MKHIVPACLVAATAISFGCVASQEVVSQPNADDTSRPAKETMSEADLTERNPNIDPTLEETTDLALNDLVERLAIEATAINVVKAERVVWPDSSLGCPEPGMMYAQMLTKGARIWLLAGDRVYAYHAGSGAPQLCENPTTPGPFAPPNPVR